MSGARRNMGAVMVVAILVTLLASTHAMSDDAPDASPAADRTWLAQNPGPMPVGTTDAGPSSWRLAVLGLFVLAIGGGAFFLRMRRRSLPAGIKTPAMRVVDAVRVGPRAQLVMVSVGGRVVLLGVTDHSVQRVAWLDEENDTLPALDAGFSEPLGEASEPSDSTREQPAGTSRPTGPFAKVMDSAMRGSAEPTRSRRDEPRNSAADEIAADTKDTYEPSQARTGKVGAEPVVRRALGTGASVRKAGTGDGVEEQVSGLAQRQPRRPG